MQVVEKVTEVREKIVEVRCDLCGMGIIGQPPKVESVAWENGVRKTMAFDLCTPCFRERLAVWLVGRGAVPRESKDDCPF